MAIFPYHPKYWRVLILAVPVALSILFLLWVGPIAQDQAYHNFVDQRNLAGLSNFYNVISNLAFILVGGLGISMFWQEKNKQPLAPATLALFMGLLLTGIGSAYYHLIPNNQSLVWDRLPMTIVFMAFFSILIDSHISKGLGRKLLPWLLLAGITSVIYWAATEILGQGDLRPYILIQYLPILLFPLIVILYDSKHFSQRDMVIFALFYLLAKLCEHYDAEIYGWSQTLSGHSLKHLFAAMGPGWFIIMLNKGITKKTA